MKKGLYRKPIPNPGKGIAPSIVAKLTHLMKTHINSTCVCGYTFHLIYFSSTLTFFKLGE